MAPALLGEFSAEEPDRAAGFLSRRIGYPVTILDRDGRVVGASSDLPFQLRGLTVPVEGTELREAVAGDVGFARRRGSGEVEIRLFAATPVVLGDQQLLLQVAVPLDGIRAITRERVRQTLLLTLPALLLAALLTHFLGNRLVRPLHALGRRARGLASGVFSRQTSAPLRTREVRELASTFDRMAEELEDRYRSLESERDEMQALIDCMGEAVLALTEDARVLRANQAAVDLLDFPWPVNFAPIGALVRQPDLRSLLEGAVVRPFSGREITLGDRNLLVSARSAEGGGAVVTFVDVTEIRRLEAVRRDFVANASHELKTPLTAMRGFAETLLEEDLPEDLRRQWLTSLKTNTLRLQHLVDDLLDLSRLESGGWAAKTDVVELESVAQELLSEMTETARERGVTLETRGSALVCGDEQGLEQVLRNLVENALRYTPEGGEVSIEIEGGEELVTVAVKDTGAGIPTSALPRIFERFYRADPARSRAEGGTGLGLAIVRHLVQAMGGEVWAESELGHGTTVIFTLPAAQDDRRVDPELGEEWPGGTHGGPGEDGGGAGTRMEVG